MFFVEKTKGESSTGASGDASAAGGGKGARNQYEDRLREQRRNRQAAKAKALKEQKQRQSAKKAAAKKQPGTGPGPGQSDTLDDLDLDIGLDGENVDERAAPIVSFEDYRPADGPTATLELEFKDLAGKPLANEPCLVRDSAGQLFQASTDANGVLFVETITSGLATVSFPDLAIDAADVPPTAGSKQPSSSAGAKPKG